MMRKIFFLLLSMFSTTLFFCFFMYIFANSVEMHCKHQPDKTFTCVIDKRLFNQVTTSTRTVMDVIAARTVESCDSDGCSYRSELQLADGSSTPVDDVYTDRDPVLQLTEKINQSIRQNDGPGFTVKVDFQWWVVMMLGAMSLIGLGVEVVMIIQALYNGVVKR